MMGADCGNALDELELGCYGLLPLALVAWAYGNGHIVAADADIKDLVNVLQLFRESQGLHLDLLTTPISLTEPSGLMILRIFGSV